MRPLYTGVYVYMYVYMGVYMGVYMYVYYLIPTRLLGINGIIKNRRY